MDLNQSEDQLSDRLGDCVNRFSQLSQHLEAFVAYVSKLVFIFLTIRPLFRCDRQKSQQLIDLTKSLFDHNKQLTKQYCNKNCNVSSLKTPLDQLFVTGFDEEQIWQQIELQNEPLLRALIKEVAHVTARGHRLTIRPQTNEDQQNDLKERERKDEADSRPVVAKPSPQKSNTNKINKPKKVRIVEPIKKSIVDDKFFKLSELEEFLNKEDIKEEQKITGVDELMSEESDEEIDYFEDPEMSESEEDTEDGLNAREAMFSDFFDPPIDESENGETRSQNVSESEEEIDETNEELDTRDAEIDVDDQEEEAMGIDYESSSESEDESGIKSKERLNESIDDKSEFERIQERLREKIEKQERLNLLDKSWQMRGEIASDRRPENSLLEEHLEFDHTQRPAPMISDETTSKLEDIIKQRIKDNAFDDVIRKVKPKEKPFEYRRRITMESEKSKQSLAEIYENEYLKQKQTEREEQQNPVHNEIRKRMRSLFVQLDALSNFNFTPRPPQPEVKIINNLPAITAEEVTPVTATDVSLLAPQEVFNNQRRELQTSEEQSKTDRNRSRRLKKKIQSKKFKYNESKDKPQKSDKQLVKSSSDAKHFSSSKKFFERLQEKTSQIVVKSSKTEKNSSNILKKSKQIKL